MHSPLALTDVEVLINDRPRTQDSLAPFKGRVIRLKFCLSCADLYAFQFRS